MKHTNLSSGGTINEVGTMMILMLIMMRMIVKVKRILMRMIQVKKIIT